MTEGMKGGRRHTYEEAERDAVITFAAWLLKTKDIAIHEVMLKLEDFSRAAYARGVDAASRQRHGLVQGRHIERADDE